MNPLINTRAGVVRKYRSNPRSNHRPSRKSMRRDLYTKIEYSKLVDDGMEQVIDGLVVWR